MNNRVKGKQVQSEAKMMIPDKSTDAELRTKVLSRMNVDNVTGEVRRDQDILTFGSRLLRSHNLPHQELTISQNMRDLEKLTHQ